MSIISPIPIKFNDMVLLYDLLSRILSDIIYQYSLVFRITLKPNEQNYKCIYESYFFY